MTINDITGQLARYGSRFDGACVESDLLFVLFKCVFESAQSKEEQDYDTKNANSLVISEGKKNGKVQKDDEASFE